MEQTLKAAEFDFIGTKGKRFIAAFDSAMREAGYDCGDGFVPGFCWGKLMLLYARTGAKSKRIAARVYVRDNGVDLRLYLFDLDGKESVLALLPAAIRGVFTGPHGDCVHCHNEKDGACRFRKSYTLFGTAHDKCNGIVFLFPDPKAEDVPHYLRLLQSFQPHKKRAAGNG